MYDLTGFIEYMNGNNCVIGLTGGFQQGVGVAHGRKRQPDPGCSLEWGGGSSSKYHQAFTYQTGIDTVELKNCEANENPQNPQIDQYYGRPNAPEESHILNLASCSPQATRNPEASFATTISTAGIWSKSRIRLLA